MRGKCSRDDHSEASVDLPAPDVPITAMRFKVDALMRDVH